MIGRILVVDHYGCDDAGTGLGLSIVQKILELHGATYGVDSKPGMGADFWFSFQIEN